MYRYLATSAMFWKRILGATIDNIRENDKKIAERVPSGSRHSVDNTIVLL